MRFNDNLFVKLSLNDELSIYYYNESDGISGKISNFISASLKSIIRKSRLQNMNSIFDQQLYYNFKNVH